MKLYRSKRNIGDEGSLYRAIIIQLSLQDCRYDKRVANICLFIYIGCQDLVASHHLAINIYTGMRRCWVMNIKFPLLFEDLQKFTFTTSQCYTARYRLRQETG